MLWKRYPGVPWLLEEAIRHTELKLCIFSPFSSCVCSKQQYDKVGRRRVSETHCSGTNNALLMGGGVKRWGRDSTQASNTDGVRTWPEPKACSFLLFFSFRVLNRELTSEISSLFGRIPINLFAKEKALAETFIQLGNMFIFFVYLFFFLYTRCITAETKGLSLV